MRSGRKSTPQPRNEACGSCRSRMAWHRSVKRKVEEIERSDGEGGCSIRVEVAARVDLENEVAELREVVARQQEKVAELCRELDQERAASASATTEAMSMILRLQREKAEVQMEARQFKRFAEEKMAHDQQELVILEDLVYKREQSLQALSCEVQAFRRRLLRHGVDPDSVSPTGLDQDNDEEGESPSFCDYPAYNYPSLKCCADSRLMNSSINDADLEMYSPIESSPHRRDHLRDLERRILHLEQTPSPKNETERGVALSPSPSNHICEFSPGAIRSILVKSPTRKQPEEFPIVFDGSSDHGAEEENYSDRVYTIDAVHSSTPTVRVCEEHLRTPRGREETYIQKLYLRLQALEADRESMKRAIMSMQTEKAQVLLKEIAQQIYSDAQPSTRPVKKLVKKQSFFSRFSFVSAIKWVASFVFWRKPPQRARYMFDERRLGLLLLLENSPLWRQQLQRILPRVRGKATIDSGQRLHLK